MDRALINRALINRAVIRCYRIGLAGAARGALLGALLLALVTPAVAQQTSKDKYRQMEQRRAQNSQFRLFAGATLTLDVNQFQCGLRSQGDTCSNVFNSPTGGGGFWPTGSPNQYMFNAGLNISGIIPIDAGFTWAGDTVGAFFFDATGLQANGEQITQIFSSLDRADLAAWPSAGSVPDFPNVTAFVEDADLFDTVLLGREAASQQDSWVMYWDGVQGNRDHPMGITVEQRTMAWNFPTGNEATIYLLYKFTNVTDNPRFQRENESRFFGGADGIPDAGFRIDSIYVAFDADPDVTNDFDLNYSTAMLPFNMGVSYEGEFDAPDFTFFPNLFRSPFFINAPGLVGVKYLKSPLDETGQEVGLTLFTIHENSSRAGAVFFDPVGVQQLWRYHSGNINTGVGDQPCTFPDPKQRRICFLSQQPTDTRFLQASGPFSLDPGESQTVVAAMFAAATVETPLIILGATLANAPGIPSLRTGCGAAGEEIRPIDVGAGWISTDPLACTETTGAIDQLKVNVVPGSLLGKALVAQTIFDNQFLLGFAPDAPEFHLVPGDNSVTIVWGESPTETTRPDPFFVAAGDPNNALFNPNYRQFDVEGYRIFRGNDPSSLKLIAQFDYAPGERGALPDGSFRGEFIDNNCETDPTFVPGDVCTPPGVVDITDPLVQFPLGGTVRLLDGSVLVTDADTLLADAVRAGNARALSNSGVSFAFLDTEPLNGFQFFYKVTAFDVNSLGSGPSSLEGAGVTKSTFPQKAAPNQVLATLIAGISGDDGVLLDPDGPLPKIDPQDGTFNIPFPPTDAYESSFAPVVARLLPAFSRTATVDSIVLIASSNITDGTQENPSPECPEVVGTGGLGASPFGACWAMHLSVDVDGTIQQEVIRGWNPWWGAFGGPIEVEIPVLRAQVPFDSVALAEFGIPSDFAPDGAAAVDGVWQQGINNSVAKGPQARRFGFFNGGSRWFDGTVETEPDPTHFIRVGHLSAVDTVWKPVSHTPLVEGGTAPANATVGFEKQCFNRALAFLGRAADVRFTWQGGTFGEVRDVTHNVDVQFLPKAGPTWGFLTIDSNGNGVLDWQDFNYIDRAHQVIRNVDGGDCDIVNGFSVPGRADNRWDPNGTFTTVDLVNTPTLVPTSTEGLDVAGVAGLAQTGTGFGLFVNGERFIFEMTSLPADGEVWTLRSYSGAVVVSLDENAADPQGYLYFPDAADEGGRDARPGLIDGLVFNFSSEASTELVGESDLTLVHTVPDPYYTVSRFDLGPTTKRLRFVNLPAIATIRIFTVSGVLVDVIQHDDPSGGGQATWDLRNRSNQFVASGVYFFHVSTPEGDSRIGKFTVVTFAN